MRRCDPLTLLNRVEQSLTFLRVLLRDRFYCPMRGGESQRDFYWQVVRVVVLGRDQYLLDELEVL